MSANPTLSKLDTASFDAIADLAYRESGLTLVREKATMVQSRLRHRLRALGLADFVQYTTFIHSDDGIAERRQLISALTTNVSHFFREMHHFEELCTLVQLRMSDLRKGGRMRIWSAGCSNGQEPLSIAIALLEKIPEIAQLDFRILATDIDANVVRFARAACYPERTLTGLTQDLRDKYFEPSTKPQGEVCFEADQKLRGLIHVNELNLLKPWPMKQPFDAIFCRNVVIYFDLPTQEALWPRFHNSLKADSILFLGHSERISNPQNHGFVCTGPTIYRRTPSSV